MPSALKSETARINGAKSKGPKTAATREKSSRNSIRHGFTAHSTVLLECENPDLFEEMHQDYISIFKPATPPEELLVDEMVVIRWRIQRMWTIETALYDREMIRQQVESRNAAAKLAQAFGALADESHSLALLSRYESRLHRMHERTYRTLRQLQQERQQKAQPDPTPPEPSKQELPGTPVEWAAAGPSEKRCESNPPATLSALMPAQGEWQTQLQAGQKGARFH